MNLLTDRRQLMRYFTTRFIIPQQGWPSSFGAMGDFAVVWNGGPRGNGWETDSPCGSLSRSWSPNVMISLMTSKVSDSHWGLWCECVIDRADGLTNGCFVLLLFAVCCQIVLQKCIFKSWWRWLSWAGKQMSISWVCKADEIKLETIPMKSDFTVQALTLTFPLVLTKSLLFLPPKNTVTNTTSTLSFPEWNVDKHLRKKAEEGSLN